MCQSSVEVVTPFWASNSNGKVRAIVNNKEFEQAIHQEICGSVNHLFVWTSRHVSDRFLMLINNTELSPIYSFLSKDPYKDPCVIFEDETETTRLNTS